MVRGFINGPRDQDSTPGQAIGQKTKKMVSDAYLLNTQCYKVHIKFKWSN